MAKRKSAEPDLNSGVVTLLRKATGTKKVKGEDLISDPALKKAFKEAKKRASKQKAA